MRAWKYFLPAFAAVLLAGCAGYHLGPVNGVVAGANTIEVQPFSNRTLQPRLGDAVTEAVRERFGREGLKRAGALTLAPGQAPFRRLAEVTAALLG